MGDGALLGATSPVEAREFERPAATLRFRQPDAFNPAPLTM